MKAFTFTSLKSFSWSWPSFSRDGTAERLGPGVRYRFAGQHGVEGVAQIELRDTNALFPEIFKPIVEAAQVQKIAGGGKNGRFGRRDRARIGGERFFGIDQIWEGVSKLLDMHTHLIKGNGGVALDGI